VPNNAEVLPHQATKLINVQSNLMRCRALCTNPHPRSFIECEYLTRLPWLLQVSRNSCVGVRRDHERLNRCCICCRNNSPRQCHGGRARPRRKRSAEPPLPPQAQCSITVPEPATLTLLAPHSAAGSWPVISDRDERSRRRTGCFEPAHCRRRPEGLARNLPFPRCGAMARCDEGVTFRQGTPDHEQ
jgi:hypothetical protein